MKTSATASGGVSADQQKPHAFARECDLVMKGGITSGVVYPLAIVEISRAFRLRSIGGTSAGAIAAAAAAAAEVGRQRRKAGVLPPSHRDFDALAELPGELRSPAASGGNKLEAFFQASSGLRSVFAFAKGLLGKSGRALFWSIWFGLLWRFFPAALLGGLLGSIALWWTPWQPAYAPALCTSAVLGLLFATLFALVNLALTLVTELPKNGFGMCTGMPSPKHSRDDALTVWLTRYYDELSGEVSISGARPFPNERGKPLTFGDLKRHGVNLQVMTTCLTMGRPFRLPFRDDEVIKENRQFYFRRDEFEKLFPARVVQWMCEHQRALRGDDASGRFAQADLREFFRMPEPDDLPLVVAVRMSLSFPVLLSAVPLYAFDFRSGGPIGKPQLCWFTDGGVGSNFPIHFFDSPVPSRPTFGLDLGKAADEAQPRVYMPSSNGAGIQVNRRAVSDTGAGAILSFLGAVFAVAKDWNHEALSHLPGYRDRIAIIRLTSKEGGLNLNMPAERIEALAGFGREAGREFVRRFGNPSLLRPGEANTVMNWENHQRIRLRLLIGSVSETLQQMLSAHEKTVKQGFGYERFFEPGVEGKGAYEWVGRTKNDACDPQGLPVSQSGLGRLIYRRLLSIATLIRDALNANKPATGPTSNIDPQKGSPRPLPEAKLRPRI